MGKHKRDCGTCRHFCFTWNKYWCSMKEKWVIPTFKQPDFLAIMAGKEYCDRYLKGSPNNLAF